MHSTQYYFGDPHCRPQTTSVRLKSTGLLLHSLVLPFAPDRLVMKVQCGETFSLFIDQHQHLVMLGWIKESPNDTRRYAHKVTDLTREDIKFMDVQSSGNHVLGLDRQGGLYVWGNNAYGKLFVEEGRQYIPYPQRLQPVENLSSVSCGYDRSFLLSQGKLFGIGDNLGGSLGTLCYEATHFQLQPILCLSTLHIVGVSCGYDHSLVWDSSGRLFSMGSSAGGKLGLQNIYTTSTTNIHSSYAKEVTHLQGQ